MHKEIEEARKRVDELWAKRYDKRQVGEGDYVMPPQTKEELLLENLLALFDRMQQEPVVRINHAGEIPQECKSFISSLDDGPVPSPGTYRRELEDK